MSSRQRANLATRSCCICSFFSLQAFSKLFHPSWIVKHQHDEIMSSSRVVASASSASSSTSSRATDRRSWVDLTEHCSSPPQLDDSGCLWSRASILGHYRCGTTLISLSFNLYAQQCPGPIYAISIPSGTLSFAGSRSFSLCRRQVRSYQDS